jgi:hypothetical protein
MTPGRTRRVMIPIKIQCGCGQRYSFEAEPVNARLTSPVGCPVCGADGTDAANAAIAQSLPTQPVAPVARRAPMRVTLPDSSEPSAAPAQTAERYRPALLPGQVDRPRAELEARAKISWGDQPTEVMKYLMIQGFTAQEASALVQELFKERAATIRRNGIWKIIYGSVLVCLPIGFYIGCEYAGMIPMKLFAVTIMAGLWGAYTVLKGIFMVIAPKSEPGDVSEQ